MGNDPRFDPNFGNGEVAGDNRWTPPVYGTTQDGQEVTVSFGKENRQDNTGIASGHVTGEQYYGPQGHDHFGPNGELFADRGKFPK